jgi:predicted ATP-dependent serine protease
MVKVTQKENKELYQCKECGFHYEEREWAEKCQAWCDAHKSCNLEIIAHSIDSGQAHAVENK